MKRNAAFTLLELLIVVLIIAALAAMIVPRLLPQAEDAKIKIARAEIESSIPAALDLFYLNVGRYPSTEEGLAALWSCPPTVDASRWQGPYLRRRDILDPWGNPVVYHHPPQFGGLDYDLASAGPDGIPGTEDDITNADLP